MKLKHLLASTLSLALVACTQIGPTQQAKMPAQFDSKLAALSIEKGASPLQNIALLNKLKLQEQPLALFKKPVLDYAGLISHSAGRESLSIKLPIKSDFAVQFADYADLASFKVWVVGPGINGQKMHDGETFLDATGSTLEATVSDIPSSDGSIRLVTAQGYDSEGNALPAFYAMGYYVSSTDSDIVLNLGREHSLTAGILNSFYVNRPTHLRRLDLAALSALVDEITGYDARAETFTYDPSWFDVAAIAALIPSAGTLPDASTARSAGLMSSSTVRINLETPGGDDFGEFIQVVISDPSSEPTQLLRTWSSDYDLDVDNVAPGTWNVYIYDASGNSLGSTNVTVDGSGNTMYPTTSSFTLDVWEMQTSLFDIDTEYGRNLNQDVIIHANPIDFSNYSFSTGSNINDPDGIPNGNDNDNDEDIYLPPGTWTVYAFDSNEQPILDADGNKVMTTVTVDNSGNFSQTADPFILPQSVEAAASEFMVTTSTGVSIPDVAMADDASFVTVWEQSDGSNTGIYANIHNRAGNQLGSDFRVNLTTANTQSSPAVSIDKDTGNFVIAWESNGQDGAGYGIYAALYNADGTPIRSEFRVNTITTDSQRFPDVSMNTGGKFVVTWDSEQGGSNSEVYARRYDSAGNAVEGTEFWVSELVSPGDQRFSRVALNDNDQFAISYESENPANDYFNIQARVYDSDGSTITSEFLVNTITTYQQRNSALAMNNGGKFVVVWDSTGINDGDDQTGVFGAAFQANGSPIGSEFLVNSITTNIQALPDIAMDSQNRFVVSWQSNSTDYDTYAQRYDIGNSSVTRDGSEFKINDTGSGDDNYSAVSMSSDGDLVIVWHNSTSDEILGKLYTPDGTER